MKAKIKRVKSGKKQGEYRFVLIANNGEIVAHSGTETYVQRESCVKTLKNCFPDFEIMGEKN